MLSELITRSGTNDTDEDLSSFYDELLGAKLGAIVDGLPPSAVSGSYVAGPNELTCAHASTPDGRIMLLTCADRAIFVQRFHPRFNAEIDAVTLLKMVVMDTSCAGLLVNSALSEHSIAIDRAQCAHLLERRRVQTEVRPWWRFW